MVKVIFSFVNSDRQLEDNIEGVQAIAAVKDRLLKEKWPEEQGDAANVRKLRFFCMGKELADRTKLLEVKLVNEDGPLPILVHVTRLDYEFATSDGRQCYCCDCVIV